MPRKHPFLETSKVLLDEADEAMSDDEEEGRALIPPKRRTIRKIAVAKKKRPKSHT